MALAWGLDTPRIHAIPVPAIAGQTISIVTGSPSHEIYDSILVLLAPDGSPVVGNDDLNKYFAGIDWVPAASGTYRLLVTSFEGVGTGELVVKRSRPTGRQ